MGNFENMVGISGTLTLFIVLVIFVIILLFRGIKVIPEGRAKIVERLGRRHKTIHPGINVIIPFLDSIKNIRETVTTRVKEQSVSLIDNGSVILAEQRMDPPPKALLAKDNSEIIVDSIVYFRVKEPAKLIYDVTDFEGSFVTLVETTLRQEVGKYDGDSIVTARDVLGENLKQGLLEASNSWGIEIKRVEIEDVRFEQEVIDRLSEARTKELIRRADLVEEKSKAEQLTLQAEATKKANILEAEGIREAAILKAQGEFEKQKLEAEGKFLLQAREQEGVAQGFSAIAKALQENPDAIVALEALKAQAKVAESIGNSQNTLIVPSETAGLLGAFASLTKGYETLKSKTAGESQVRKATKKI